MRFIFINYVILLTLHLAQRYDSVMKYTNITHRRRSIRLREYDYSSAGAYFITICVQHHACLLAQIADGQLILGNAGRMVNSVWDELPTFYPGVRLDEFVVMPNHIHGIVMIVEPKFKDPPNRSLSLPDIVHRFKTHDHFEIRSRRR